jgi:multidrug efflux pump subunit AcrB
LNVEDRLNRLFRDFLIALGIVVITLLPLGLRASAVVMISIPLSLLIGLALLQVFGFGLNQLAIAGFILSLGLLVDDSIVVTENIARRIREGEPRLHAAIHATGQISVAVIGCTATLMLAFLPLMFLPEGSGKFIRSLPVTVLLTVGASLIVALTIIPFLASRLLSPHENPEGNAVLRRVNSAIHQFYRPLLHWGLAKPWLALGVIFAICLTAIPVVQHIGTGLFPPADSRQFLVRIELPDGAALARTQKIAQRVDALLAQQSDVEWRMMNIGRGNPQIFYNLRQLESRANFAESFVQLREFDPDETPTLQDRLRTEFDKIPGAQIKLVIFENGPPIEAPIAVRISGDDLSVLKALSARVEEIVRSTPGTRDIFNPIRIDRTDLNLGIDEAKAAALGVPAGTSRRIARMALTGEAAARFRDPDGDDYPVSVRLPFKDRNDLSALEQIYLPTSQGTAAALSLVATPRLDSAPARIDRFDRLRSSTVTAYTQTGFLTSAVSAEVFARLAQQIELPPGYEIKAGGQAEAEQRSFSGMGSAIMIAVGGILAVLILEFGRFRTAAVVAGVIPLGLFGAVIALWISGYPLSFTATIGLIALVGIEIKNSILLVDFTEQLRREGVALMDAIERAGEVRFLPVLLTSLTAIGGLIPLAAEESGLYSPLAIAIIGGLIASTLLSRIATPVMYLLLARSAEADARHA